MPVDTKTPLGARAFPKRSSQTLRSRLGAIRHPVALVAIASTLALIVLLAPTASAQSTICTPGPEAGKCSRPGGVAVDREKSLLYVADKENNRIDVFNVNGSFVMAFGWGVADGTTNAPQTCTGTCFAGIAGSGSGQLRSPSSIAVDNAAASASHHDVYVVENPNHRVQKFDPEGHFLRMFGKGVNSGTSGKPDLCTNAGAPTDVCGQGSEGGGVGQFNEIVGIGVDGAGLVDVADMKKINNQCALPGIGGTEFEKRAQRFNDSGEATTQLALTDTPCGNVTGFAVSSGGNFYLANEEKPIDKYSPAGTLLSTLPGLEGTSALGIDGADDLFVAQREVRHLAAGTREAIVEYDSSDTLLRRFGYDEYELVPRALAPFHTASGEIFIGTQEPEGVKYLGIPPSGPIVPASSVSAAPIGNIRATLNAEVNPEGKATEYHFEYVTQKGFEEQGNSFTGPQTKATAPVTVAIEAGTPKQEEEERFFLHGAKEQIGCLNAATEASKCLLPETEYRYRILATNTDGAGLGTVAGSFKTKRPIELLATWSTEVGPDSATLHAELNPLGIPASGVFEYVEDAKYQLTGFEEAETLPAAGSIDFGSAEAPVSRSAPLYPLSAGTTYHYRVSAIDSLISEAAQGEEHTFRTFPATATRLARQTKPSATEPGALLPDCRAYEMVSPLDKEGGDIAPGIEFTTAAQAALDQSSLDGSRLAYGSVHPFGDIESAPYVSQFIAARDAATGWHSHGISPPKTTLILPVAHTLDTEFKAFSPDLCQAWFRTVSEPVLAPGAITGFPNIYRRSDQGCGEKSFEAITLSEPPPANTPEAQREKVQGSFALELQGLSSDGSAAIYVWNDNLPAASPTPAPQPAECVSEKCATRLYEQRSGGALEFVCVLPGEVPSPKPCTAGTRNATTQTAGSSRQANVQNAISEDGQRVFWSDSGENPGKIYVRIEGTHTVAVSKAAEEASKTSTAQFWMASKDGSKAIFTTGQDLYEFAVDTKTTTLLAHEVAGVLGASEDATKVYFASEEAIPGSGENSEEDEALPGKPNLYLYEAGSGFRFVATLAGFDVSGEAISSTIALELFKRNSKVSADGEHLAFMSAAGPASTGSPGPTGYDNTDADSGKADDEVYLYDADSGQLLCASCNPSGARPVGKNIGNENATQNQWAAATLPTWENTLYAPRALSADGSRLFFTSTDALLARDTNGLADVYQWEAPGTRLAARPPRYSFSAANGGCIDLISTGKSARKARTRRRQPER